MTTAEMLEKLEHLLNTRMAPGNFERVMYVQGVNSINSWLQDGWVIIHTENIEMVQSYDPQGKPKQVTRLWIALMGLPIFRKQQLSEPLVVEPEETPEEEAPEPKEAKVKDSR